MAKSAVLIKRADVTRFVRETLVHDNDDFDISAIVDGIIKQWPEVIGWQRFSTINPDHVTEILDEMVADDVEMGHYETFWDIIQAHNLEKGACDEAVG